MGTLWGMKAVIKSSVVASFAALAFWMVAATALFFATEDATPGAFETVLVVLGTVYAWVWTFVRYRRSLLS